MDDHDATAAVTPAGMDVSADARPLPGLTAQYRARGRAHREQTLAHGLLISGAAGLGKRALAGALARAWLCQASDADRPCGRCRSCGLTAAGSHPDFRYLQPAEGKTAIAIDQVRALGDALALRSHADGASKVAVIAPAEAMTVAAQNSLLKTLEEPTGSAILVLVTEAQSALTATIRSRCQRVTIHAPSRSDALAWLAAAGHQGEVAGEALQLAGNAPLAALDLIDAGFVAAVPELASDLVEIARGRCEPVATAGAWDQKLDRQAALRWLQGMLLALARVGGNVLPSDRVTASQQSVIDAVGERVPAEELFAFVDEVNEAIIGLRGQANPRLILESVLIGWARATRTVRGAARR
jgi:DNA polymerase-3 subunit delta'